MKVNKNIIILIIIIFLIVVALSLSFTSNESKTNIGIVKIEGPIMESDEFIDNLNTFNVQSENERILTGV